MREGETKFDVRRYSAQGDYYGHTGRENGLIGASVGDLMEIFVKKSFAGNQPPSIEGLAGLWLCGLGNSMSFMCSPNVTPGEYKPFVPWESSTHYKAYNKYPSWFEPKVTDWHEETVGDVVYYYLRWTLQRAQNANKTVYNAQTQFPLVKEYSGTSAGSKRIQRANHGVGHYMEFINYWRNGTGGNSNTYTPTSTGVTDVDLQAPKYTLTGDDDEVLYVGTYNPRQYRPSANTSFLGTQIFNNGGVAGADGNIKLVQWQHLWKNEPTAPHSIQY